MCFCFWLNAKHILDTYDYTQIKILEGEKRALYFKHLPHGETEAQNLQTDTHNKLDCMRMMHTNKKLKNGNDTVNVTRPLTTDIKRRGVNNNSLIMIHEIHDVH